MPNPMITFTRTLASPGLSLFTVRVTGDGGTKTFLASFGDRALNVMEIEKSRPVELVWPSTPPAGRSG